ncbi:MAG: GTP 3',8-cyclase MoaA [Methylococcaceae bacterium]|jgi:cyclic pyranopterin phosphate synthase|nr:GTP 3',8-cyclase MoaA [Methylococcaceae bacterium]MDZ4156388.1 GTP 3',8-cyclase MoaA [Methylococcales bacterium]MDP2394649.1 GTP 3',8-cyclase MoaA [Methylococcaceae bacterium]MDP3019117.1 GTP 3',8-cyclase MoaA [Methylococcaceae bacterium]MDP3390333.1 GTP 3',8-cyclase MoaA [Methylococcaceae bacterium]
MTDTNFPTQLIDRFGRTVDYLRISITDRCDFRCVYCMSEDMTFLPRAQILSLEEIYTLAKAFAELGVKKIRITGGEPLVRKGALELLHNIGQIESLKELVITTNGSQLESMAKDLKQAGVKRINISLDTLDADKFKAITRTGDLQQVLRGIQAAKAQGFERIKINAVILKNRNHLEVNDLVQFAVDNAIDISFIEEMPLGMVSNHDRSEAYYSSDLIKKDLARQFSLMATTENTGGPSKYLNVIGTQTRVGFISPHSNNFCSSCNRVRLTVEGQLLLCLGNEHSVDLKQVLREHPGDLAILKQAIIDSMLIKPEKHEFNLHEQPIILRHMSVTGG